MSKRVVCLRRSLGLVAALSELAACTHTAPQLLPLTTRDPAPQARATTPPPVNSRPEPLATDTPETTSEGATFTAPAGWRLNVHGPATILESPEGDSHLAIVDVHAQDANAAVAAAWAAYRPDAKWPLELSTDSPDKDGWTNRRVYQYQTSPNEKRDVQVSVQRVGELWTALIHDLALAVADKRAAAVSLVSAHLFPKGYARESFVGKAAHHLDRARLEQLTVWLENAQKTMRIPGISVGLVEHGTVILAKGFGTKQLGQKAKPDADTLYLIASNTKALTTLLLARLVDQKCIAWDTPVTQLLPSFRLGSEQVTRQVQVKHLVCACTGLPRQDLEWLFHYRGVTPEDAMATLATIQPTSKFGEMFQYSNLLAGAAGFVGGHVLHPNLELGAAYDAAMNEQVFRPLGMKSTTFDYVKALRENHAADHAFDIDGNPALTGMHVDYSIRPLRPAGGVWSNVRDLLAYVSMELAEGELPNGRRYIGKQALLERRLPQVSIGNDQTYGMGLKVDTTYGIPVVHHGGDLSGYHSDMMWLPEQGVGAVLLTNGEAGWIMRVVFRRKLLELLFDGKAEADADAATQSQALFAQITADRKLLTVPASEHDAAQLAQHYANDSLGDLRVIRKGGATVFDFGEWRSEVASRKNPDASLSFVTIAPGDVGAEFVVGTGEKRTLILRDDQHEYVFTEHSP